MHPVKILSVFAAAVSAAKMGFNYGSTFTTGVAKNQSDFESEFTIAANLKGAKGFTSARLYTMVQAGTTNAPISAIPAAIKTNTTLLLGLWASAGEAPFGNELTALKTAIDTYGADLAAIVDGISIGSEDMYRISPDGIIAHAGIGAGPDILLKYINMVKTTIANTTLQHVPLGHVDTWNAWDNVTAKPLVDALDWLGMDVYPYFESTKPNSIAQSKALFQDALNRAREIAGEKEVWITETGHPVSGKVSGDAVASVENAEKYWKTVGCPLFGQMNVWWYTLQDASPKTPNPSFGLLANNSTTPLYDLNCHVPVTNATSAGWADHITSFTVLPITTTTCTEDSWSTFSTLPTTDVVPTFTLTDPRFPGISVIPLNDPTESAKSGASGRGVKCGGLFVAVVAGLAAAFVSI